MLTVNSSECRVFHIQPSTKIHCQNRTNNMAGKSSSLVAKAVLPVVSIGLLSILGAFTLSWATRVPTSRLLPCLSYVAIFCVGMEYVARYEHKFLWHSKALWFLHASHHHRKGTMGKGPSRKDEKAKFADTSVWEDNDVFPIIFASLAISILAWTVFTPATLFKDCLMGTAGGISLYGTSYFMGHDLCAHERGGQQLADWLRRISPTMAYCADVHSRYHHNVSTTVGDEEDPFGPPYGFWLGPLEIEYAIQARKSGKDDLMPMPRWAKLMFRSALAFLIYAAVA